MASLASPTQVVPVTRPKTSGIFSAAVVATVGASALLGTALLLAIYKRISPVRILA